MKECYRRKPTTAHEALRELPRQGSVLLGFYAAQPPSLVQALADRARADSFDEVRIHYMHPTPHTATTLLRMEWMDVIKPHPCYMGPGERALASEATQADGAPGEIRTPDPQVRSLMLYPTELRARRTDLTDIDPPEANRSSGGPCGRGIATRWPSRP